MPISDQCRWIGISPIAPAENIPVDVAASTGCVKVEPCPGAADLKITLNGEVVHVIIDSG